MKSEPFIIEQTYNVPASKVWKAITDRNQMKLWYFDIAEFRPEVGFEFEFSGENEGRRFLHLCKVIEVVPEEKLSYSWRYDGYEGNSVVTFELFSDGDKTRLRLTHEGLETFPINNPDFKKENFAAGWNYITGTSLKKFVETENVTESV
jgi:uncharacterized protein YndB with AHSA1/START domain